MEKVNIQFAKTYLSQLLARVRNGEEIVIASRGKPFARIVPFCEGRSRRSLRGQDVGKGQILPQFFDELPEEYIMPSDDTTE